MDPHLPAPVRSLPSHTPSPSHSASASATSSLHKRKRASPHAPPFTSPSNDDLESISGRTSSSDEQVVDEDEDDYDAAIRTFTSSRLEKPGNAKNKTENLAKVEAKESGAGLVVKEDSVKSIFTENIQTSGAYSAREENLKREEEAGQLTIACVRNDGIDDHMVWLIGLKNIFARQLPNMPKEYIVRLVMDRSHKSVMLVRRNTVVGGITYRPYLSQKFGEIAFCAITSDEQVKGYGTRLMNHLKQHARDVDGLTHFLTYADNNAVGYFNKQGFTKEIYLEQERWHGYIKDYDGGILMECKIDPKLPYTDLSTMIRRQRQAIDEKIRELSNCHIVYTGIDFQKKEAGVPKKLIKVEDIPGLREAGWSPDQWGHSRFKTVNASADSTANQKSLTSFMRTLLKAMYDHPDAWPFKEPVDSRDVPDYYDIIRDPMDLKTMSKRVESEQYYVTFEMFVADARRMFSNARTYNSPETIYYKCSTRLEAHFSTKVQTALQACLKIQQ
ncbi:hypothetical protein DCAR_0314176 [Daucus carota subsp. sativus]|uniref:histone acetyltransferase n=1 Tax=Daucus carota subsp. sativus TaxID=79200 RepID=A0AAF0WSE6_DAUCS|nr:PREDICTED: histone acetyltransferase GCN5-like [Daucus carota subsp. sativus]WOG94879.1 hypothetical protein DCAR_0314176 [Daucus carota subsp. sativus]